jgi:ribose transport system substrate-binding protein
MMMQHSLRRPRHTHLSRWLAAPLLAAALAFTGCDKAEPQGAGEVDPAEPGQLTLAVIPKGTTHVFWQSVEAGAREAATELGVRIYWRGPLRESDRGGQIDVVQQFVSQGVDGVALAPLDSRALRTPVTAANRRNIPVVIFDSALEGEAGRDFISFVATDNREGGRAGGEKLAELLGGEGKVVMMRYLVGSASTTERESGFLDVIQGKGGITVLSENQHAGATASEAHQRATSMLSVLREADGIFTPNESSTYGMLLALRQAGLAGRKLFVGFDASPPLIEALRAGEIHALVVQNPRHMGYMAVKTLTQHLRGEEVPMRIDTGVAVVTADNLDDPAIQALLQ